MTSEAAIGPAWHGKALGRNYTSLILTSRIILTLNAFTIIASVHQLAAVSLCCCVVASLCESRWQASRVHSARSKYKLPAQSGVSAYQCVPLSIIQVYNSEAGM